MGRKQSTEGEREGEGMSAYYCPNCTYSIINGSIVNPRACNLSGSFASYNLYEKYRKHVLNEGIYSVNSVFTYDNFDINAPIKYQEYEDYCFLTSVSGSLEIDDNGRSNLVWYAQKPTGELTIYGSASGHLDSVKLVLWYDAEKIHAFPTSSVAFFSTRCAICGCQLQ